MKMRVAVGAMLAVGALAFGACSGTLGRGAERVSCVAGSRVTVACGGGGIGSCAGDPILDVCDGSRTEPSACVGSGTRPDGFIASDDDSGDDRCPMLTITCPTSGSLSVRPRAFSGVPTCNWDVALASGI